MRQVRTCGHGFRLALFLSHALALLLLGDSVLDAVIDNISASVSLLRTVLLEILFLSEPDQRK